MLEKVRNISCQRCGAPIRGQKFCSYECYWASKVGKSHTWGHKIAAALTGKPKSPEHTRRAALAKVGKPRPDITGSNAPWWKGGLSSEREKVCKSLAYKAWRRAVFQRDDYTCQRCATRGGYLEAHHDLPYAFFPDLRFEILNGITLCRPCHDLTKVSAKEMQQTHGTEPWYPSKQCWN